VSGLQPDPDEVIVRVLKRDGRLVEVDRDRLARSLRLAGTPDKTAREIASRTTVLNGVPTLMLRAQIIDELGRFDRELAARFGCCRRFNAIPAGEVRPGRVHLHVMTLRQSGLNPGVSVRAEYNGNIRRMVVEKSDRTGLRQARISQVSLDRLGIFPGFRLLLNWIDRDDTAHSGSWHVQRRSSSLCPEPNRHQRGWQPWPDAHQRTEGQSANNPPLRWEGNLGQPRRCD
jgi:hypothetical protein